jgi:hypothetical protein
MMVYLRESLSAKYPVESTPTQAPSSRIDTSQPFVPGLLTADAIRWSNEYILNQFEDHECQIKVDVKAHLKTPEKTPWL